jgi:hypothetical protein
MKTKTNINLIVNGTKVYTRKTTGRPYTHALVVHSPSGWRIESCSSKGTGALLRQIVEAQQQVEWYRQAVAAGPNEDRGEATIDRYRKFIEVSEATRWYVVEIIDNTVTINN